MLTIIIQEQEFFDEETQEFQTVEGFSLTLEHSLLSMSKWESEFEKPFLSKDKKTTEEVVKYVECMILNPVYPTNFWVSLTQEHLDQVNKYIDSNRSATTFRQTPDKKGRNETITSELIYYWMVAFNIPFECEHWHLNRLFALIKICNLKQGKQKPMSKGEQARQYRELNAQRRAQLGTSG